MINHQSLPPIAMRDYDQDAAEALEAFGAASDVETREGFGRDYVSAAAHAEIDRRFISEGLTTKEAVAPYLNPLQNRIRSAVGTAIRGQDRWVELCFYGRLQHLAASTYPAGRA